MKNTKKKKKRSRAAKTTGNDGVAKKEEEEKTKLKVLEELVESFSLTSIDEAASAFNQANGDPDKAAELLRSFLVDNVEDPSSSSTCSMSSGGLSSSSGSSTSGSSSSERFVEMSCVRDLRCGRGSREGKQKKKVVAATGTVSTVLGKEYVRRNATRKKVFSNGVVDKEEAEQFLCSLLGDESELSFAVVRDVLCE